MLRQHLVRNTASSPMVIPAIGLRAFMDAYSDTMSHSYPSALVVPRLVFLAAVVWFAAIVVWRVAVTLPRMHLGFSALCPRRLSSRHSNLAPQPLALPPPLHHVCACMYGSTKRELIVFFGLSVNRQKITFHYNPRTISGIQELLIISCIYIYIYT